FQQGVQFVVGEHGGRLVGDVGRWDVLHRVGGLAVPFSDQPVEVGAEVPPVLVGVAGGVGDGAAVARRRLVVVGPAAVQAGGEEQADVFGTDLVDGCGHAMMLQVVAEPVAGEHVGGDRVVAAVGGFEGERARVEQGPQGCRAGFPGGRHGRIPLAVAYSARAEILWFTLSVLTRFRRYDLVELHVKQLN